jgi:methionyl-tRNA formyltransferase
VKIVFLGTPEFSVMALDAIIKAGHEVAAVVTMPDKPAGRGMQFQQSAVKKYALDHQLKVLQPQKLRDEQFISELREINADIQVVIAFRMLPEVVWSMPKYGTINLHASLLPDYRGAAPINWAIINGDTKSGVCTFLLKHEIDTGDILLKQEVEIGESTSAGELHDTLMQVGAEVVVKSLEMIEKGNYQTEAQPKFAGKLAPKIFKQDCQIDWSKSCSSIYNLIRGLSPYPAAHSQLYGKVIKIFKASNEIIGHQNDFGKAFSDGKTYLKFACSDGYILVNELQLEGKKRMLVDEFLRGYKWID